MQKSITLLSSFQATVQDYNKSHDIAAAREKGKVENPCYLEKGAGYKQELWILLQKYYQQVVKDLEAPEGSWPLAFGLASCRLGSVPPAMKLSGGGKGVR